MRTMLASLFGVVPTTEGPGHERCFRDVRDESVRFASDSGKIATSQQSDIGQEETHALQNN
jgi:hypothetical protein